MEDGGRSPPYEDPGREPHAQARPHSQGAVLGTGVDPGGDRRGAGVCLCVRDRRGEAGGVDPAGGAAVCAGGDGRAGARAVAAAAGTDHTPPGSACTDARRAAAPGAAGRLAERAVPPERTDPRAVRADRGQRRAADVASEAAAGWDVESSRAAGRSLAGSAAGRRARAVDQEREGRAERRGPVSADDGAARRGSSRRADHDLWPAPVRGDGAGRAVRPAAAGRDVRYPFGQDRAGQGRPEPAGTLGTTLPVSAGRHSAVVHEAGPERGRGGSGLDRGVLRPARAGAAAGALRRFGPVAGRDAGTAGRAAVSAHGPGPAGGLHAGPDHHRAGRGAQRQDAGPPARDARDGRPAARAVRSARRGDRPGARRPPAGQDAPRISTALGRIPPRGLDSCRFEPGAGPDRRADRLRADRRLPGCGADLPPVPVSGPPCPGDVDLAKRPTDDRHAGLDRQRLGDLQRHRRPPRPRCVGAARLRGAVDARG